MHNKAQGTIEYLVIIAIVIVISLVVVGLLINITGNNTADVTQSSTNLKMSTGPIAITDSIMGTGEDANGALIIQNNSPDTITSFQVNLNGKDHNYYTTLSPGGTRNLALSFVEVNCAEGQKTTNQPVTITYINQNGLSHTINYGNVSLDCTETPNPHIQNPIQEGHPTNNQNNNNNPTDTTPPVIHLYGPTTGTSLETDINFTVTDANTISDCTIYIGTTQEGTTITNPTKDTNISRTITFDAYTTYTYDVNCTDIAGNKGSANNITITLTQSSPTYFTAFSDAIGGTMAYHPKGIAVDASGNSYITGWFCGNTNPTFGSVSINTSGRNIDYAKAGYVAKVSNSGEWLWAKQFDGTGNYNYARPNGIAVDASGNVYVTGTFCGTEVYFGDQQKVGTGEDRLFVTQMNQTTGNVTNIWATSGSYNSLFTTPAIATDSSGGVYITGTFCGNPQFDQSISLSNIDSDQRPFVARLNPTSGWAWASAPSGSAGHQGTANAIALDGSGRPYIVGNIRGGSTLAFGTAGTWAGSGMTNASVSMTPFIARLSTSGDWENMYPIRGQNDAGSNIVLTGVTVDTTSNTPYVYGDISGAAINSDLSYAFDGIASGSNIINSTFFIAKYNPNTSQWVWAKVKTGSSPITRQYQNPLVTNQSNGLTYIAGTKVGSGTAIFGSYSLPEDYFHRAYAVGINSSGDWSALRNVTASGNGSYDLAKNYGGIAIDTQGNLYIQGTFSGNMNFPTNGSAEYTTGNAHTGEKLFVWKTSPQ